MNCGSDDVIDYFLLCQALKNLPAKPPANRPADGKIADHLEFPELLLRELVSTS